MTMPMDMSERDQAIEMEALNHLAELAQRAWDLGFSLQCNGTSIDIFPRGEFPLTADACPGEIFTAQTTYELSAWLNGVAYGRKHIR